MEVRHLQAFVAVAGELHFGRAAARLQLSPSPVSRTVLELERELGVPLFVRGHHRVQLTDAGTALLPRARELLDSWSDFTSRGRALARDNETLRIRVGSPSLAPAEVVDQVVAVLADLRPGVPADVEFAASVHLLSALRSGDIDMTVALLPLDEPDLRVLPLGRYEFGLVVNDHDELASKGAVTPEDLAGRRVLLVTSVQPTAIERIVRWLAEAGAIIDELPDADLARMAQLVRHGRGVTLTGSAGVAAQIFAQPGLTVVPLRDTGPRVELGLVWRAQDDGSALVTELTARLAGLVRAGPLRV